MLKLNDTSNDSKECNNIYNRKSTNKINIIKYKRNSFDITKLSRRSFLYSKQKTNYSESSYNNKISKIKDFMPQKNNSSENIKCSISFKAENYPLCLSFMTNTNNYINSINKKFRVRNYPKLFDNKITSDNTSFFNNEEKNKKIVNLKLINNKKTKEIKQIMSKINFHLNKTKKFLEENTITNSSSVNIKNYNYFIGTLDKSINIIDQKEIFNKREKIKNRERLKYIKFDEISKIKKNYKNLLPNNINLNLKLNLPKKKFNNILTKQKSLNLSTSTDINIKDIKDNKTIKDIKDKETPIKNTKIKSSSELLMPKLNNISNNINKKDDKKCNKDLNYSSKILLKKNSIKTINSKESFNNLDNINNIKKEEDKKENNKTKRKSKKSYLLVEKNLQKRISDLQKRSENRKKIKYSSIIIKKEKNISKKIDQKKINFIKKLISINNIEEKINSKKIVRERKINIILYEKNRINKIISNHAEILNFNNHNFFTKYVDKISLKKNIMYSKDILIKYKTTCITLNKLIVKSLHINTYISFIKKCFLDINLRHYISTNLDFSSIRLPQINENNSLKQSLLLPGITPKINQKKEIFLSTKTKFIESNKYQGKNFQIISLYFITKELEFYNILKSVNFLDEENGNKNLKKKLIHSISYNRSPYKSKKTLNFIKNKMKLTVRNNNRNNTHHQNSLSVLEDKKFFNKEKKKFFIKKFRNSINATFSFYKMCNKNNFKKILPRASINPDYTLQKDYQNMSKIISLIQTKKINHKLSTIKYNLLKQIKLKENIESLLRLFILENETNLFIEYFNEVIKQIDINSKDKEGNTFLILSIKSGMNYISKILLENGVDVNMQNKQGNTALHYALSRKNFEMADLLKKYGAYEDLINKKGFSPWECLGKAVEYFNE